MLNFNAVKEKVKKENPLDLYDFPVLLVNQETEEHSVQKFEFNSHAINELDLTHGHYVGIALTDNKELVLVNLEKNESLTKFSAKLNKDNTFNSKKIYSKICKFFNLNKDEKYVFNLNCKLDIDSNYLYATLNLVEFTMQLTNKSTESFSEENNFESINL